MSFRTKPPLECAILNNRDQLAQRGTDSLAESDQSPALVMGQRDPFGEFSPEDLILDSEVLELGNQLIVIRSAERQEFGQVGGIHGQSRARIRFLIP